jgi:hypothetical protein
LRCIDTAGKRIVIEHPFEPRPPSTEGVDNFVDNPVDRAPAISIGAPPIGLLNF